MVETILKEAKKQALHEFKTFPRKIQIKLKNTSEDEITVLARLLNIKYGDYDEIFDVRDTKKLKSDLLSFFVISKEVYDTEMNFQEHGYNAQIRRIMLQFLAVKKIDYLQKRIDAINDTQMPMAKEKIEWLGTTAQLGYLVQQLIEKKYILESKKISKRRLALLFFEAFQIMNLTKTDETTFVYFYNQVLKSPGFTSSGKEWVTIKKNLSTKV